MTPAQWTILLYTLVFPSGLSLSEFDWTNRSQQNKPDTEVGSLQPIYFPKESTTEQRPDTIATRPTSYRNRMRWNNRFIILPTPPAHHLSGLKPIDNSLDDETTNPYRQPPGRAGLDQLHGVDISEDYFHTVQDYEDATIFEEYNDHIFRHNHISELEKRLEASSDHTVHRHRVTSDSVTIGSYNPDYWDYTTVTEDVPLENEDFKVAILKQRPDSSRTNQERKGMSSGQIMNAEANSGFNLILLSTTVFMARRLRIRL